MDLIPVPGTPSDLAVSSSLLVSDLPAMQSLIARTMALIRRFGNMVCLTDSMREYVQPFSISPAAGVSSRKALYESIDGRPGLERGQSVIIMKEICCR